MQHFRLELNSACGVRRVTSAVEAEADAAAATAAARASAVAN